MFIARAYPRETQEMASDALERAFFQGRPRARRLRKSM